MTAEEALAEIWGTITPDCGPTNYAFIVEEVSRLHQFREALREMLKKNF